MRLRDLGEFGFIERIRPGRLVAPERVIRGIGDDCSVTPGEGGRLRLLTTDLLVERVHFLREAMTPRQLGAKAMAVNLSDIAAMGGTPLDAWVCLAVPEEVPVAYLDGLYDGLMEMAGRHGVNLLGGDTTGSKRDLVLNVAVSGEVPEGEILYREGARVGDHLFVTGSLGDSAAGLDVVLRGRARDSDLTRLLARRHLEPLPHLAQGRALAASGRAHAMIDVSDGIASDLGHLADASGVGFVVEEASLPVSDAARAWAEAVDTDPLAWALAGGEDYVLLVAGGADLPAAAGGSAELVEIGRVVEPGVRQLVRADGRREPLVPSGWDHFRGGR